MNSIQNTAQLKVPQSFINENNDFKIISSNEEFSAVINDRLQEGTENYHRLCNMDLSAIDVDGVHRDFDGWNIENVIFSRFNPGSRDRKEIFGLSFMGATLKCVCFAQAHLYRCNFDTKDSAAHIVNSNRAGDAINVVESPETVTTMNGVTFFLSNVELCRFRGVSIKSADFRYSYINDCTIREAEVEYGDFYFCNFRGCTTFDKSIFRKCSFTNCMFENNAIRMDNIPDGIIQEYYNDYRNMVVEDGRWLHYNPSATYSSINHAANYIGKKSQDSDAEAMARMSNMLEASTFYKSMSGIYAGKGLNRDSNRAYKMSKLCEIRYLHLAMPILWQRGERKRVVRLSPRLLLDYLTVMMGFGYMWWVVVFWFVALIVIYGAYYYAHSADGIDVALSYSFNNSLGPDSNITKIINCFLASCQSAFGMLLIGFLGFIMANNLRNDS